MLKFLLVYPSQPNGTAHRNAAAREAYFTTALEAKALLQGDHVSTILQESTIYSVLSSAPMRSCSITSGNGLFALLIL